jgi:hypothetical protein
MAHMVKCLYCGEHFDADKIAFIKIGRRYAHEECGNRQNTESTKNGIYQLQQNKEQDVDEKRIFFDCINETCKGRCEVDWAMITKEYKRLEKAGYSINSLTKTFYYVYEIIRQPLPEKLNNLFLVEKYYENAKEYYKNVFLINKANKTKAKADYETDMIETSIVSYTKPLKFFDIGE